MAGYGSKSFTLAVLKWTIRMSFRTLLRKRVRQSVFVIFISEKPLSASADDAGHVRIKSISPKMLLCPFWNLIRKSYINYLLWLVSSTICDNWNKFCFLNSRNDFILSYLCNGMVENFSRFVIAICVSDLQAFFFLSSSQSQTYSLWMACGASLVSVHYKKELTFYWLELN